MSRLFCALLAVVLLGVVAPPAAASGKAGAEKSPAAYCRAN